MTMRLTRKQTDLQYEPVSEQPWQVLTQVVIVKKRRKCPVLSQNKQALSKKPMRLMALSLVQVGLEQGELEQGVEAP